MRAPKSDPHTLQWGRGSSRCRGRGVAMGAGTAVGPASMGPLAQSGAAEGADAFVGSQFALLLQWGRGSSRARKAGAWRGLTETPPCFTGAALSRARKAGAVRSRANARPPGFNGAAAAQSSRGRRLLSPARKPSRKCFNGAAAPVERRGGVTGGQPGNRRRLASMGPRLPVEPRKEPLHHRRERHELNRFNGAAAPVERGRSAEHWETRGFAPLQWGRGSVERGRRLTLRLTLMRWASFNGAAAPVGAAWKGRGQERRKLIRLLQWGRVLSRAAEGWAMTGCVMWMPSFNGAAAQSGAAEGRSGMLGGSLWESWLQWGRGSSRAPEGISGKAISNPGTDLLRQWGRGSSRRRGREPFPPPGEPMSPCFNGAAGSSRAREGGFGPMKPPRGAGPLSMGPRLSRARKECATSHTDSH